jgi:hypothetical protein
MEHLMLNIISIVNAYNSLLYSNSSVALYVYYMSYVTCMLIICLLYVQYMLIILLITCNTILIKWSYSAVTMWFCSLNHQMLNPREPRLLPRCPRLKVLKRLPSDASFRQTLLFRPVEAWRHCSAWVLGSPSSMAGVCESIRDWCEHIYTLEEGAHSPSWPNGLIVIIISPSSRS